MWGQIAAGAMSLAGGLMGNSSSAKESKRNRDWQEYMSNTAHQRQVADLKAAGLNPMLSVMGGSGAATPSGGIAAQANPAEGAAQKIQQADINTATADNINASTDKLEADTINTQVNTAKTLEETKNVPLQGKLLESQAFKISHEIPQILRQGNLTDAQTRQANQITDNLMLQPALTIAQTRQALAQANLSTQQINLIAPQIQKLHAETRSTYAGIGSKQMMSLPGDLLEELFSNSADGAGRSNTSKSLGSLPNYVEHQLNQITERVRKQRREIDKTRSK